MVVKFDVKHYKCYWLLNLMSNTTNVTGCLTLQMSLVVKFNVKHYKCHWLLNLMSNTTNVIGC